MPYRTFEDSIGGEWQVWDIVPRLTERRVLETDRRVEITPIQFADRRRAERRMSYGVRKAILRGSFAHGWLCFDNGLDKRRLSPIPEDWTTCSEGTIEAYLRAAELVPTGRSHIGLQDEQRLADAG